MNVSLKNKMRKLELFYPVKPFVVVQGWGVNGDYYQSHGINIKGHNGYDLVASDGQPVYAAHDGIVTYAGVDGANGELCVIRTEDKRDYNGSESYFKTMYCHLQRGSYRVKPGQRVQVGDIIALSDNTGFSTGSHLHFGLKPVRPGEQDWQWYNLEQDNGYNGAIDPTPYFSGLYAADYRGIRDKILSMIKIIENLIITIPKK